MASKKILQKNLKKINNYIVTHWHASLNIPLVN